MVAADHLEVKRQHGLFNHHGIDLGDGTVAHYLEGREILRSSLYEFSSGQKINVINHKNPSAASITLSRAISRIGEKNYNLLFNNCEHFASWCKTGVHRSHQLENFLQNSSLSAIAIGQVIPAALIAGLNVILKKGISNEKTRQKANLGIQQLRRIRENLYQHLEDTLEKLDIWFQREGEENKPKHQNPYAHKLLIRGQSLADQLNALESLEFKINAFLNTPNHKN